MSVFEIRFVWGGFRNVRTADLQKWGGAGGKQCLVCSSDLTSGKCNLCGKNMLISNWVDRAAKEKAAEKDSSLAKLMYDDPLFGISVPWLRVRLRQAESQSVFYATCWLCESFKANKSGRSQLGYSSKGLAVGSTQIVQFKDHVVDCKGKPCPEHDAAYARYKW